MPIDQGGSWIHRNKGKRGGGPKKQGSLESASIRKVHNVCRFTLDELQMEWERRGKGSFMLTGVDSPTCWPSDLQTTPGSHPGRRSSVVLELLGQCRRAEKGKEREGRAPLKGKKGNPSPFLGKGRSGWFPLGLPILTEE